MAERDVLEPGTPPSTSADAAPAAPPGVWGAVLDSVRGVHRDFDYTSGPIGRAILLLAVPMVLEMVMESVFAVVDIFFVARLGPDAVATVGLTESMLAIIYAVAMGLSIGVTALVARRIGEGDRDGAARAATQGIFVALFGATALGAVGAALAPQLLALMGASPAVIDIGVNYTRVMLGGEATIVVLFVANAIFRGAGDAAIAMRVLWLANAVNIALNPCLIFGLGPFPELGVTGSAVATTIGRGVGATYAISRMLRPGGRVSVERRHLRLEPALMRRLLGLSGSGTLQMLVGTASWIGLIRILSTFGSAALAGYTIGIRIIIFALLPSWGLCNAAATMVGQALGAKKPERAEASVWMAGNYNLLFLGAIGLAFVLFARPLIALFTADPEVQRYGVDCLRVIAAGFLFYAHGMVITQSFNGAGDTATPTWINLFVFWLWEIPLAYVLAVTFGMGPHGVFLAVAVAFSTLALVSAVIFRRGHWKTRVV